MTDHKGQFPGFPPEPVTNYWPYPRALNGWWHVLSGNEQKCLDYILRHTWGYKKDADAISYSQFINGITKRDGTVVDKGTGIKNEKTIRKALRGLSTKGFIEIASQEGGLNIYKLKITPSQSLAPVSNDTTLPLPKNGTTSYQNMVPTIKDIPINKNNTSASQTNNKISYKDEITDLVSYLSTKLGGIQFPNYGKQAKYIKSMLDAGYSSIDVKSAVDLMLKNSWWVNNSFDMKNVADEIPKLKANKKISSHQKPSFIPCRKDGCEGGYILNKNTNSYIVCQCKYDYEKTFNGR